MGINIHRYLPIISLILYNFLAFHLSLNSGAPCPPVIFGGLNRNSERIPRSLLRD